MKKETTIQQDNICKHCGDKYTVQERNRVYGSNPLMQGYCSAGCYTQGILSTTQTPLEVNEGKQPAKYTPGKLEIRRTSTGYAIDTDNDHLPGWKSNPVFEINRLSPYAEANAARIVLAWNEHDGLCKTVGKLSLAVSNRDKEIEALKAANRELLEALKELTYVTGHAYDGKPALVKARTAISKHSKQTT